MIEGYDKAILSDLRNKNDIAVEVNWSKDPKFENTVKLAMDGKEAIVSLTELYSLVWTIADPENQERLMPVKQTTVRKIRKLHVIQARKDIKRGDFIRTRCETNVPVEVYEGLKGMMPKVREYAKKTNIFIPQKV